MLLSSESAPVAIVGVDETCPKRPLSMRSDMPPAEDPQTPELKEAGTPAGPDPTHAPLTPSPLRHSPADNPSSALPVTEFDARRIDNAVTSDYALVWRVLRRLGLSEAWADDATQMVFITLIGRIRDVEVGRERAFLLAVCPKVVSNLRRQRGRHPEDLDESLDDEPGRGGTPEDLLDQKRKLEILDSALEQQLLPEQRLVFVLSQIEGLSLRKIADSLSIPVGTVASRLRRARKRLQRWAATFRRDGDKK